MTSLPFYFRNLRGQRDGKQFFNGFTRVFFSFFDREQFFFSISVENRKKYQSFHRLAIHVPCLKTYNKLKNKTIKATDRIRHHNCLNFSIMGKENLKIVKDLDVKELIKMLKSALSEEWMAYYQYWVGARVIEGAMRPSVEKEFIKHAQEELQHAEKLVTRIIQLEGTPVLSPEEWFKLSKCKYLAPTDPHIETVLGQNLTAERCAIGTYQKLADFTFGKDHYTYKIALDILESELEHEQYIEDWLKDMSQMKTHLLKK